MHNYILVFLFEQNDITLSRNHPKSRTIDVYLKGKNTVMTEKNPDRGE